MPINIHQIRNSMASEKAQRAKMLRDRARNQAAILSQIAEDKRRHEANECVRRWLNGEIV